MFTVRKRMEISAMHRLDLDYESPCTNNHGHNWLVIIEVKGPALNKNGMLLDFKKIKDLIHSKLDHKNLNEVFDFNPTAENIALWIRNEVDNYIEDCVRDGEGICHCHKVTVVESENNVAEWSL